MNTLYYLKNENGEILEINDGKNSVFNLTSDLGYSKALSYVKVGDAFIKSSDEPEQRKIEGQIVFIKDAISNEENYKKYEKFIRTSKLITFVNKRYSSSGIVEFLIDTDFAVLGRQIKNGHYVYSSLTLYCTTNWYSENNMVYTIEESAGKAFGFPIDFVNMKFSKNTENSKIIENTGYTDAPIYVLINGPILQPKIEIIQNDKVLNCLQIPVELEEFEAIEYSTRDNDLFLNKINVDGTEISLFDLLDQNNVNNFFKLPVGTSTLKISAETNIKYAKIIVYRQY